MNTPGPSVELLGLVAFDELTFTDAQGSRTEGSAALAPGAGFWAVPHPDDAAEAQRAWQAMRAQAPKAVRHCIRLKHADGSWRWIEASLKDLTADARVGRVVINWRDVSAQRQVEATSELTGRIGPDGVVTQVSPGGAALLGLTPDEIIGTSPFAFIHSEDLEAVKRSFASAREKDSAVPAFRVRRKDRGWTWLEANVRRTPAGELVIAARDVSQKRKSEEQFLQAQKMDAVGRLAGGVAHDFNNLLSIITSASTLLQDELPKDHPSHPMTEEIRIACRRAAELTRQLLAFSRRQMLVAGPASVNEIVKDALAEVTPTLPPGIRVVEQLDPKVAVIEADSAQLERVLVSLLTNAKEAMAKGGVITVTTSNLTLSADDGDLLEAIGGDCVRIEVKDEGVGMNAVTRAHLFEPFFTTKPRGKGVGLGLATSYGIIRQTGGHILVRSEEGEGTAIALLFPTSGQVPAPAPVAEKPSAAPTVATGTETILLVEDDSAVRRVAAALLTKKGYRVIQADGGKEALAVTDAELATVDLLLTDVMMPGMTGPEIATALQGRRTGLRVLFMSGYNNESVHNILHKPFTLDTLTRRVREMLDGPAPG